MTANIEPGPILLIGAGGHGAVVLDIARCLGIRVAYVLDESPSRQFLHGVPVVQTVPNEPDEHIPRRFVVAIGDNESRNRVFGRFVDLGYRPITLIHPFSSVSPLSTIGSGTVVCAGAVIGPGARLGENCIVNTGCSIDHDCLIQDHAHICPGVHLAGNVSVGAGTMIGAGAVAIPGVRIGAGSIVGAGSVVVRDLPDHSVAFGNPAKPRRKLNQN